MPEKVSFWEKFLEFLKSLFGGGSTAPPPEPAPRPEPQPPVDNPDPGDEPATPPDRPEEPAPADGPFVFIDPGHGGADPGAVNSSINLTEKEVVLAVGLRLKELLEARGYRIGMTRNDDLFVELFRRAEMANEAGAEAFVSIHCNSALNTSAEGIETYHHTAASQDGVALATEIQNALVNVFVPEHRDRGVKSANFVVLRETIMPAALVETEFISHERQSRFLADPANQDRIAQTIADGLDVYFGL